jgi:hypothetical protein
LHHRQCLDLAVNRLIALASEIDPSETVCAVAASVCTLTYPDVTHAANEPGAQFLARRARQDESGQWVEVVSVD